MTVQCHMREGLFFRPLDRWGNRLRGVKSFGQSLPVLSGRPWLNSGWSVSSTVLLSPAPQPAPDPGLLWALVTPCKAVLTVLWTWWLHQLQPLGTEFGVHNKTPFAFVVLLLFISPARRLPRGMVSPYAPHPGGLCSTKGRDGL